MRDSSSAPIKGSGPQSLALLPVHTLKSTIIINIDTEVDIDDSGELNASDVSELKTYTGEFDCSELSSESYLVTDVNASSSGEEIIASIKVAFESFEKTLQSKELELEQLTKTISELKDSSRQIRDKDKLRKNLAKKSTSSSGSGKIKKSKPTRAGSENTKSGSGAQDSDDKSEEKSSSFSVEALSQYVLMGGALALEHRAFLLFPIAAAAIFFGGEVMSV